MRYACRLALVAVGCIALVAQSTPPPARVQQAAQAVAQFIRADPAGVADLFSKEFLAQVPAPRLEALCKQLYDQLGPVTGVRFTPPAGGVSAAPPGVSVFTFTFAKGFAAPVSLTLNADASHNIAGLLVGPPQPVNDSFSSVLAAMKALPGQVSFQAQRLNTSPASGPVTLAELNPDQELGIGSAFKLYVLGALSQQIAAGQRHWDQVVPLREHSFPSGQLQKWPLDAPLTLQTLASLMISISDNTAADNLLLADGRAQVETMQAAMGHSHPELNQPFLTTLEMFQLKYGDPARRARYLAADPAARRAILAALPPTAADEQLTDAAGMAAPRDISQLEWFASAADLDRAMAWYQAPARATERQVLAINPGIPQLASQWAYVGFKGGSEPGVLSLNFLLRSNDGHWYTVAAIWNNPQAPVDESQWVELVTRAIALLR